MQAVQGVGGVYQGRETTALSSCRIQKRLPRKVSGGEIASRSSEKASLCSVRSVPASSSTRVVLRSG